MHCDDIQSYKAEEGRKPALLMHMHTDPGPSWVW
jgi:hypothetical protein